MKSKFLKILILVSVLAVIVIAGFIAAIHISGSNFDKESVLLTNKGNNGFTVYWETKEPTITKARVYMRDFDRKWDWQYDDRDNPSNPQKRTMHHVTFTKLSSKEDYIFEIANTSFPVNLGQKFFKGSAKVIDPRNSTAGIPDRVFGYVFDNKGEEIKDAIVFLTIDDENYLSVFTQSNGSYSFDVSSLNPPTGHFLEKIKVISDNYPPTEFIAQSNADRPVPDITLSPTVAESVSEEESLSPFWLENLMSDVMANNSCFKKGELGGLRAQCDTNIHWMTKLNVNNCPSPTRFRVGLVAHTFQTFLYEPDNIRLRLLDEKTGAVILDDIKNGEYVIKDRIELKYGALGQSFKLEAYKEGGETCSNVDIDCIIEFASKTETYPAASSGGGSSRPGGGGSPAPRSPGTPGTMPPISPRTQSCKKYGENFAVPAPVSAEMYGVAADLGMSWGETMVVTTDQVRGWGENVVNASSQGITPILRICWKGACEIENGEEYGRAIVDLYRDLLNKGQLPSNGLFIHAGHNEPNAAEYRSPKEEGEFVAGVIREIRRHSDVPISRNPNDAGIKLIGPNLDLFNTVTGDHQGEPIYTATDYLDEMVQHCGGVSADLYAMAVNHYYITHDGTNFRDVHADVSAFIEYLKTKSALPNLVFITEIGKAKAEGDKLVYTDAMSWTQFGENLAKIDSLENVQAILLFDSLGMNPDPNFEYHKPLWDDASIIQDEILSGCSVGSVRRPQEGPVPSPGGRPNQPGGPIPVSPVEPTDGLYCGDFNCTFVSWNGISEIYLPVGWHAWWDEGSTTGGDGRNYCGDFANNGEHFHCGRPEYGPMSKSMFANRAIDGDSLKYFSTFRTHNAGVFTAVRIGSPGVSKNVTFKAKALSWTAPDVNWYHGQLGIHPDGGIDRASVIWGEYKQLEDINPEDDAIWTDLEVSVTTTSDIVTLFIRGNNQYALTNNDSYWENAELYVNGQKSIAEAVDGLGGGDVVALMDDSFAQQDGLVQIDDGAVLGEAVAQAHPGLPSADLKEPGRYRVVSSQRHILLPYVDKFEGEEPELRFFYDKNMNLEKDPDEPYVLDMGTVKFEKVGDVVKYDLYEGFNFISLPLNIEGVNRASDFLGKVRENGGYASSVSTYYSGYWISYNDIAGYGYGEDFKLLPGRGYVIKVENPTTLVLEGDKYSESVPFDLIEGWNLVGLNGSETGYTARSLLQAIYKDNEINADNVTTWFTDTKRYVGFHYDPKENKYSGDDFSIEENRSYFIRVLEGDGVIKP